ncbi:uncharacterized protein LOC127158639 isoform X1 [Labeo rohita]|uniref:uncharacterized protein LOC127158639 isoform X1 n=1 Tax=Labeo rohita TaxID=84645 RepID=UPI0021E2C1F8|nr:uncharacterized protein LOC127158639 isoform X1 [Labeo rohita]
MQNCGRNARLRGGRETTKTTHHIRPSQTDDPVQQTNSLNRLMIYTEELPSLPIECTGVSGADEDKVKTVVEGDSVTLNPDPAQIQGFNEIQWRFKNGNQPIAYTSRKKLTYSEDERFRDRLKLDPQTGSLTITNIKTKHSGVYRLRIELDSGQLNVDYTVTVNESPSIINDVKGEMKMESVTEGDRVTLQTDVTKLHGDELIVWRFGDEGKLIAKTDIEAKSSPLYYDERSRDRLELDHQTGSLIITNSRITDSGLYRVKISSSKQTLYKRFTVTVSGEEHKLSERMIVHQL